MRDFDALKRGQDIQLQRHVEEQLPEQEVVQHEMELAQQQLVEEQQVDQQHVGESEHATHNQVHNDNQAAEAEQVYERAPEHQQQQH